MSEPEITANEVAVDDTAAETPIVSETVPSDDNDDAENVDDQVLLTNGDNDDDNAQIRLGTTSSARFNILSTMVGGGSLSLPFAFAKSGNVLVGPVLLVTIAFLSEYCFRILVQAARILSYPPNYTDTLQTTTKVGHDSFESLAQAAFGPKAYVASMTLVTLMCFFGTVGYAVLLRDMLEPITAAIYGNQPAGPSWQNNSSLWVIVLVVTPLCTLQTLTSLKRFGAASMFSVLILGCCILFRSSQCNLTDSGRENDNWSHWTDSFQLWPDRWWDVLDAFPLYISCYVCHYNILTVHNELRQPTVPRVTWWLRSTTWTATAFYLIMGVAGSAYGAKCTPSGQVQGNVLLDFDNSDPLLLVGRMCLAITITLAFPMLTIPARDIVLRSLLSTTTNTNTTSAATTTAVTSTETEEGTSSLEEPLLSTENDEEQANGNAVVEPDTTPSGSFSFGQRLGVAIVLFWSATAVASCVSSIDVVWDLLGSSLSILLSVLIPCASFLVISHPDRVSHESSLTTTTHGWVHGLSRILSWSLIVLFIPLMFLSTGNAVYHTFF